MEEKTSKKGHYDKRLIVEIVKKVEEGVPRKALREQYGLGKKSIDSWMRKYGSDNYHQTKRKEYSKKVKQQIVVAIEQGRLSIEQARVAYNVDSGDLIRDWIKKHRKEKGSFTLPIETQMAKKKKAAEVKSNTSDIQKALEEAQLKIIALNTMIDVAEEQLKIDIRKKFGAKPSLD